MSTTLEEIARQAGVSRSTVSRVMNDHPSVDQDTRARVRSVAERLNYQPNVAARSLAVGRTNVIGLVIPMGVSALFTDPYFPLLIQGITSACNANEHSVMLWLAEPEYERRTIRQVLQGGLIDGVILASALMEDPMLEALLRRGLPFIMVGRLPTDNQISYVDVDNVNSAREMVAYLLRLGHRRVATIAGPTNMIAGSDRLEGYRLALRNRGLTPDPALIVEADFTEEGGYVAMQRLLPEAPNAVFVASDAMAIGAMRALRDAGLRVPDDIAIAGFDDIPMAARTEPTLTTVRQPIQRMGSLAAETLIDMISHPHPQPRRIILPTELVIRESSGSNHNR
ncbi:MAG: LacI family transcriptional regulator [Chloroflexota bacterium]|nr:LacI family transcriptional regulator [Chloroflexota bacterium]MDQ5867598.1 LacI family transcriptional regulator [Chloroflexota bacterium]